MELSRYLRHDEKIKLNLDRVSYPSKPDDSEFMCPNGIKIRLAKATREVLPAELFSAIQNGRCFSPGALTGTNSASWVCQRIVGADIDAEMPDKTPIPFDDQLTIEQAKEIMYDHDIWPLCIYKTFGWVDGERQKFRVLICLEDTITDPELMKEVNRKFQALFKGYDRKCKNLDRVFFGSTKDSIVYQTLHTTKLEAVLALPDPETRKPKDTAKPAQAAPSTPTVGTATKLEEAISALRWIDPDKLPEYDQWLEVISAAKKAGIDQQEIDNWSSRGSKYEAGEIEKKWNHTLDNFNAETLFFYAYQQGWVSPNRDAWIAEQKAKKEYAFSFDDEIDFSSTPPSSMETTDTAPAQTEATGTATGPALSTTETTTADADQQATATTLDEFRPFDPFGTVELPVFPTDALPDVVQQYVQELAAQLQVDESMCATAALATLALVTQHKYWLEVRPGWEVPLALYTLIVADSAQRKSPVISAVTAPLRDWQQAKNSDLEYFVDRYQTQVTALENAITKELSASGKNKTTDHDIVNDLKDQLRTLKRNPVGFYNLLLDDATPESLASIMETQKETAGIISTEPGAFDTLTGRYSSGSVNCDLFLKAWCADTFTVSRIGRKGETLHKPLMSVLIGCQPVALQEVMRNKRLKDRGVCARFLYCYPRKVRGSWAGSEPVSRTTQRAWSSLVQRLAGDMDHDGEPVTIRLGYITGDNSPVPAAAAFYDYVEDQLERGELETIAAWAGKYREQVFRIAGILAVATNADGDAVPTIDLDCMRAAIRIGEYYMQTAILAHTDDSEDGTTAVSDAKILWRKIADNVDDNGAISHRNLYRLVQNQTRFRRGASEMDAGLNELGRHGYIRAVTKDTGGRPSTTFFVNPAALATSG